MGPTVQQLAGVYRLHAAAPRPSLLQAGRQVQSNRRQEGVQRAFGQRWTVERTEKSPAVRPRRLGDHAPDGERRSVFLGLDGQWRLSLHVHARRGFYWGAISSLATRYCRSEVLAKAGSLLF